MDTIEVGDEIIGGYLDGLSDDRDSLPASMANRSDAYVHGWLNGRDDRLKRPREEAWELRNHARALKSLQTNPPRPRSNEPNM